MWQLIKEQGCILKKFISVLRSSIYIEPVLTSRDECNAFEDLLFFRSYFCLWRDFCQPACPFQLHLHSKQPLTIIRNATNLRTLILFFLSRDPWSCATHSLDLCILFKFIFLYLRILSAPFLRFSHILRTPIYSFVYYHAEYFSYLR